MSSSRDIGLLVNYTHSYIVSKALFTACELGIFDALSQCEVPMSAAAVAERLGTNADGTERLMSACVGMKLLEVEIQNDQVTYKNTELSQVYLTKNSPKSLHPTIDFISKDMYPMANHLTDAVREGKCQYEKVIGMSSKEFFNCLFRSEERMLGFINYLHSFWNIYGKEDVISAFDLTPFHTICDLGGCSGTLARELSSKYPESHIFVYDLPAVVEVVKKYADNNHVHFEQGNFFEDPLPDADLYVLAHIIHDWPEDKCLHLLKKVFTTCKPGGGVLIVEAVLNEDRSGPLVSQMQNLSMLLQTEGKERTSSEFESLLKAAGFENIKFNIKGNLSEAILALK
ncbi:hypothetical protein GDO86_003010 [Hymenochirus boettgeri]|uniref:Acetylserotonin O-methyltransferase n=1 Tax=Hymenochirus boettgeri TaxID=247094 RepID=A0A8T2K453_9PIPI|nr:hypothetical protein GDO86_003010 [Hymenochirus boettgeri]KAG8450575.1 hypothetical protein GDO86_003010 [Hymenochirus boettgeri]KAG8450576.1 hypothetical protein GDO86_003010 [Hymenochirus boettgeri]KAG8450577.1 hypothetical protein GDO86_003010 [Hymenochirus boettgeri]KAG8450578.1 hypothetical protein GDO86_003010 [Hymenochirus boettgeri]